MLAPPPNGFPELPVRDMLVAIPDELHGGRARHRESEGERCDLGAFTVAFAGDQCDSGPAFVLHHAPVIHFILFRLIRKLEGELKDAVGDGGIMIYSGIV